VKARSRKPPLRLSAAEVAEIDQLIEDHRGRYGTDEQREQERKHLLRHDEEELQRLIEQSPKTPWPKRVGPGPAAGRDGFLYVSEADGLPEQYREYVVEVARRDGVIRYALAPDHGIDPGQYWKHLDPSWQFVMDRLRGVHPNDADRAIQQAIGDMVDAGIPPGRYTMGYVKDRYVCPAAPKDREKERDGALAFVITHELKWIEGLLKDRYKDPKTRAAAYVAPHWRKVVEEDDGRPRFNSGEALSAWLRRHDPTKSTLKMSCARGPSERSSES
jgi:hypothetical protein